MLSAAIMGVACSEPIVRGPKKGQPATGTDAGYMRHKRAGETPCPECQAARSATLREWKVKNPGADTARKRQWRLDNPERNRETERRHRQANRDSIRANQRRYRERYPERVKASWLQWFENNVETARAGRLAVNTRRRAALREATVVRFTLTELRARLSMFAGCWMCGETATEIDHVKPLAAGGPHCLANLRPACMPCNRSKGAKWPL